MSRWLMVVRWGCVVSLVLGFIGPWSVAAAPSDKPAPPLNDERICEILKRPIDVEFRETPLAEVVKRLEQLLAVPFHLDRKALNDASIAASSPVTQKCSGITARTALTLIVRDLDLAWSPYRGEMILVTTPEQIEQERITRILDVHDLTGVARGGDLSLLVDLIQTTIQPQTWMETAGGSGTIKGYQAAGIDAIVVSTTWSVHQDIDRLLAGLRSIRVPVPGPNSPAGAPQGPGLPEAIAPPESTSTGTPREEKILAILRRRISFQAREARRLSEVVPLLADKLKLPIVLDKPLREYLNQVTDAPITFERTNMRADAVLDCFVRECDLEWSVQDESILITTINAVPKLSKTYDVRDLSARRTPQGKIVYDAEELIDTIRISLGWDRWDASDESRISSSPNGGAMVVHHTWRVHREIADLLEKLRAVRRSSGGGIPLLEPRRLLATTGTPARQFEPRPALAADGYREMVTSANDELACGLFGALRGQGQDNLLFSPVSITTALGMLYAGARGATAEELAKGLKWDLAAENLHCGMASLLQSLRENPLNAASDARKLSIHGTELLVANRLWPQVGYPLKPDYVALLRDEYRAEPSPVDFRSPAAACARINSWVKQQTAGKIDAALGPEDIDPELTRLVLANTVYFKGPWLHAFPPEKTRTERFHAPGRDVEVPMMSQARRFRYADLDGLQVLELPYIDRAFSMVILLPADRPEGLALAEDGLTPERLNACLFGMASREVHVFLPRMTLRTRFRLEQPLAKLGIKRLFNPTQADLSGVSAEPRLYLGFARHQAIIEVDEEGTVAAAVTAGGFFGGGPPKPVVFRADRPFLFLIVDRRSGCVLFLGRCVNPTG